MSGPLGLDPSLPSPLRPVRAIDRIRTAAELHLVFPADQCQRRTREAFNVPTDGTPTAVDGWHRSTHRVGTPEFQLAPYGALHRWSGGSGGDGHVAVDGGRGTVWSVDIGGAGWHRTTIPAIHAWAPSLVYLGWTLDIDGVVVAGDHRSGERR